jgi:ATP-binding cassette subfamily F protein uup
MDEPTNDLDLETLELLEQQLVEWPGTLLLVSHDRVFLDNVVTSTIVFEGDGRIEEYVGGYADWLRQRRHVRHPEQPTTKTTASLKPPISGPGAPATSGAVTAAPRKLSYNEQRELAALPARIEALESEHTQLQVSIASPEFYKESADAIAKTLARSTAVEEELLNAYARWDELQQRQA